MEASGGKAAVADLRSERNNKKWRLGSFWALCRVRRLCTLPRVLGEATSHLDVSWQEASNIPFAVSLQCNLSFLTPWCGSAAHPGCVLALALPDPPLSSSAMSPGQSRLAASRPQVSSFLQWCGRGRGFQLVVAPANKDFASSKSRLIASYACLSKPVDLDIPSPLMTSSHLVAASKKAKLGTSFWARLQAAEHSFLLVGCLWVSESTWPLCSGKHVLRRLHRGGE